MKDVATTNDMAEKKHPNIRIVDIARMAGVSTGTVDRVIHRRGKVSDANLARVNEVLRQVDYHPNLVARSLASGRCHTIAVVMPHFATGEYWADVDSGIRRAEIEAGRYNVAVRRLFFDQYDRTSFDDATTALASETFDGAVIATLFAEQVVPLTRELDARSIPYVFVDSHIPACRELAYFGTSSFDAGVVAARLLTDRTEPGADLAIAKIVRTGNGGSNQCRNREAGFRDYLARTGFAGNIREVELRIDDREYNTRRLDDFFREYPRIAGAVTFNSTCHILGDYLARRHRRDVRLVGYDNIRRNEELLRAGIVTALVAQRPDAQGYHSIMALCGFLTGTGSVPRINNMPIDILLRENIDFYKTEII